MTSIILVVMAGDKSHSLPSEKEPARHRSGEIVQVCPLDKSPGPGGKSFYNLRINDIPATFQRIKTALEAPHLFNDGSTPEYERPLHARRKFVVDFTALSVRLRDRLQVSRFLEMTWLEFTAVCHRRVSNSRDRGTVVTDGDL